MKSQWKTKLFQFEYDASYGKIWPTIEFPLKDANLKHAQLRRCLTGISELVDFSYQLLTKIKERGKCEMPGQIPAS